MEEALTILTETEVKDYKAAFDHFDQDKNGTISRDELKIVIKTFGYNPTKAELEQIFEEVDGDGNGVVDYDEFIIMLSKKKQEEIILKETFASFDIDGDGFITRSELVSFLEKAGNSLSEEQVQEMMEKQDENDDGQISYQEFMKMMQPIIFHKTKDDDLMRETFSSFDLDGDGFITKAEIVTFMARMGETLSDEQLKEMIGETDEDGDGRLSYEEFVKMMSDQ